MSRESILQQAVEELRDRPGAHLPELFSVEDAYSLPVVRYFEYYGLDLPERTHRFGTFEHGPHRLAAHVIEPANPQATVVVLHGYLDHAGIHRRLIRGLTTEGYGVALLDLPGHGLSSGERAAIGDFEEYVSALGAFLGLCRRHLAGPFHLVGHSTGCAVILDHVLTREGAGDGRVALVAPLVRSYGWHLSGLGNRLTGLFLDRVPRVFRRNSSDLEFLRFVRRDPLQPHHIPLGWQRALRKWIGRIEACPARERDVLVVQGTKDTTVDWRFNEPFLRRKLPHATIRRIAGGRHHLLNEALPMRDEALDAVVDFLDGGGVEDDGPSGNEGTSTELIRA